FLVPAVLDGKLDLQFANNGGSVTNWEVNSIEIRKNVAPYVGTITITPPAGPFYSDGTTVDTYNGSGAAPNSYVTISAAVGTLTSADASAPYQNVQVATNASGNFSFTVKRPAAATSGAFTADDVTGFASGSFNQTYVAPPGLFFDFNKAGNPDSPTQAGYVSVLPTTSYPGAGGYGWTTSGVTATDRGNNGSDNLREDFQQSSGTGTFKVNNLTPNTEYF